jgi:cell division protein FtsQ
LLCGAVYTVFFSPLLGVTAVTITGAPDTVAGKVRAAVDVPTGTPLARVDLDDVAAEVEAIPEVEAVEVARGWPDTLAITVTPRVPVAVTSANGRFYLLDDSGDPYLAVDAPPGGLITVQLVAPGVGDPSTVAALAVAGALTPDFRAKVASISARTEFDVELTLVDGRKIIWGEATESAQKMQILPALLAAHDGTEYDITDPTLVSVR